MGKEAQPFDDTHGPVEDPEVLEGCKIEGLISPCLAPRLHHARARLIRVPRGMSLAVYSTGVPIYCYLPESCPYRLKSERSSDPEAKPWDGSGAYRKKGNPDFAFFMQALLPNFKRRPVFLIREIREDLQGRSKHAKTCPCQIFSVLSVPSKGGFILSDILRVFVSSWRQSC